MNTPNTRYVYDLADGDISMKPLLGSKGANLSEMVHLDIPVPDGFTVATTGCVEATKNGGQWPNGLWEETLEALERLESRTGRTLGGSDKPLLLAVRSGAVISMPGMMDTILNLGISADNVDALGAEAEDPRFAWDSYRRFLQMYGEVVDGVPAHAYEDALSALKNKREVEADTDLSVDDLKELVAEFIAITEEHTGAPAITDPREQLRRSIGAVFDSWLNPRAGIYRKANNIPDSLGTAVNIMQMVFGNRGTRSGTGVCFTRDPSTGENEVYGEFLIDAQGEDVVAGIRTPRPMAELADILPDAYQQLIDTMSRLEQHYKDMQDIEFTIEDGTLYLLQTRSGKRTAAAAVKIARDQVEEGLITREEALLRIDPSQLEQLLHPAIDPDHTVTAVTRGLNASPGAAVGEVVFDSDTAVERGGAGDDVVLVRWETTPDDIAGTIAAQGVLTAHGGMTSHAAVVARGMGKPCVAGASEVRLNVAEKYMTIGEVTIREGDVITLDGSTGEVFAEALELIPPQITDDFAEVASWADDVRRMGVRANADTGEDAARAREFGAEGIGLCRTEHMFMSSDRLPAMKDMILSDDDAARAAALEKLLPMQQADFEELFDAMSGLPVTIRLLDPPLHEFLPDLTEQALLVQRLELEEAPEAEIREAQQLLARVKKLTELNPMLGTRGVRLAMLYPQIPIMQAQAIARAALAVRSRGGDPHVEIMVPLVAYPAELERMRTWITDAVEAEFEAAGDRIDYSIGTMIELPRAAVVADQIAEHADFFSFGTNDLTQTGIGISRDDAEGGFLSAYLDEEVIEANPFASIDEDGIGALVRMGVDGGRKAKPDIKLGVCGEHGGDPQSIAFLETAGLDYVSCSPFRVPVARFAAARATLTSRRVDGG